MQYVEEFLSAPDGHQIPIRFWRPRTARHILVIAHGMAEYCERYTALAEWLNEADIAVIALNHRGHGMDCADSELGYFADHRGWSRLVDDLHQAVGFAQEQLPDCPVTLLGHSMGSFIGQSYLQAYGHSLNQVIFSATNRINRPKVLASRLLIAVLIAIRGRRAPSALVDFLGFGQFNRRFRPTRTASDWLSRDTEQVDAYVDDPYCGFPCSLALWQDLLGGMLTLKPTRLPKTVPIHLLSGSADALGEFGQGILRFADQLRRADRPLVTFKLYPGARHEVINETNADEVWSDIRELILHGRLAGSVTGPD
ncbi:alpha/beta hydrolase [Reinekea sp.]|jgi:alpha-beta hydrolase superfamily lysophospholipase|uniref:alpha/beta hydrolase n=1 Tax=Reinekea sp. TaxID=1970455 RepID=UPI002A83EF37|nr:alpha/beta hydrolase [Reinekea sp.]